MKNLTKINTWLPIFPGFYGTIFEPEESQEIEYINQERKDKGLRELNFDAFQFNYKEYEIEISKKCCDFIEEKLKELGIECTIKFEGLDSPREYNFRNDVINCEISLDLKEVKKQLIDNKDKLSQYFKDKFTSCDGFISFWSNDINDWINDFDTADHTYSIGAVLESILMLNDEDNDLYDHMYYYASERVYLQCDNYDELVNPSYELEIIQYIQENYTKGIDIEYLKEKYEEQADIDEIVSSTIKQIESNTLKLNF